MAEGFHDFVAAEVLTAANVDDYLLSQTTMRFASAAARDAAIVSPVEGMRAYTKDVNRDWLYSGSAWVLLPTINPPRCKATQPGGHGVLTATATAVPLETEVYDSDSLHSTTVNPSRILMNQIGRWAIWFTVRWTTSNAAGHRESWMAVNSAGAGSGARYGYVLANPYTGSTVTPAYSSYDEYDATAVTDYVELLVAQTSGSTLTIGNSGFDYDLSLSVRYIGPIF